jgi:hypothetical protein
MNQPKFKFGDKVQTKYGRVFEIELIRRNQFDKGLFAYVDERAGGISYDESELKLYQEPQKKKLYAYEGSRFYDGEKNYIYINFSTEEYIKGPRRCPEYDIEYPEATK